MRLSRSYFVPPFRQGIISSFAYSLLLAKPKHLLGLAVWRPFMQKLRGWWSMVL